MRPDNVQIVAGVSPADRGVALPQREVDVDVHADFGDLQGRATGLLGRDLRDQAPGRALGARGFAPRTGLGRAGRSQADSEQL
jgi:hypothetical protein